MRNLPNIATLLNLFLGSVAMVLAIEGLPQYSAIIIGICSLLDLADGLLARLLKAHSALGQQLDSLADLVSFGLAPSAIVYHYMVQASQTINPTTLQIVLPFSAFLLAAFAGLRLGIFNIDSRQTTSFIGLPTPANAAFFASMPFVLAFASKQGFIFRILQTITESLPALLMLVLIFSWLMVSPIPMFSQKLGNFRWKGNEIRYIFVSVVAVSFLIFGLQALALVVIFYIILSLLAPLLQKFL